MDIDGLASEYVAYADAIAPELEGYLFPSGGAVAQNRSPGGPEFTRSKRLPTTCVP